jgi:hypothetical protein
MREQEFLDAVSHIEADVVESFVAMDARLQRKAGRSKARIIWTRIGAVAACFAVLIGGVKLFFRQQHLTPAIPIVNVQSTSGAPLYYGSKASVGGSGSAGEVSTIGLTVKAQLIEALPDTYTFFDDWKQQEYRLLRMKTQKLLQGGEMTEEFYYLVPVEFMTDFSRFDCFVIRDMAQITYEYGIMYNKTQGTAEQLNLVIFGYHVYKYDELGEQMMAYNDIGVFDQRLWNANDLWKLVTEDAHGIATLSAAELLLQNDERHRDRYVHLLKDVSKESADMIAYARSFDNGFYIPAFSSTTLSHSPEVQLRTVRYINGFATNEYIHVLSDSYEWTKARFEEQDMDDLPDLFSALTAVASAYEAGEITPPHIRNHAKLKLSSYGIFGWYAKTEDGVIGVVRVTWSYYKGYMDDAYFIIESGSDQCRPIDRNALLRRIGSYETTYIYDGAYNHNGKIREVEVA